MAVIYVRQSKDRDGTGAAVDRQLDECRALAAAQGLSVIAEYIDNDTSASKGVRPGFQQLVGELRAGHIDTVIVWATDRLYRRLSDLVEIVELAERSRLRILTVRSGDLDLTTPAGRMLAGMLGSAARYEVEQKGARQVAANRQRASAGVWQFSRRPYGYERSGGEVVLVEAEAAVLREGYARSLAGESGYAIVGDWNARGITAPGGKRWSITQLRARLANPHYAGLVVHQGEAVGPGKHPAIVSVDDFEALRAMTAPRAGRTVDTRVRHLLSGLASCGVCGGQVFARPEYRTSRGEKVTVYSYACRDKWCVSRNMAKADEWVSAVVVRRLSDPQVLRAFQQREGDLAALVEERDRLTVRLDALAVDFADDVLTRDQFLAASVRLRARLDAAERSVQEQLGRSPVGDILGSSDVAAAWDTLDVPQKRAVLRALGIAVVIEKTRGRVFDPASVRIAWG